MYQKFFKLDTWLVRYWVCPLNAVWPLQVGTHLLLYPSKLPSMVCQSHLCKLQICSWQNPGPSVADLPEGQKLNFFSGHTDLLQSWHLFSCTYWPMSQSNPALWLTRPLECPSSAFVTLYHHYFPSPISGIYTPLPSLSSQQNLHSFFSTQLESPLGTAPHSSFCSINHTEDRFPPWYSEFNFFTFLPPSLLSTSLGARTSVSPRTKHQKSRCSETMCWLLWLSKWWIMILTLQDGRCGRRGRIQQEEKNHESGKLEEQVRNYISQYLIS